MALPLRHLILRLFTVFALLCPCLPGWSQSVAPAQPSGLAVRLLSWQGHLKDLLVGDTAINSEASDLLITPWLDVKARGQTLKIARAITTPEGLPSEEPLAEITLPEATTRVLIILAAAPAGSPLPYVGKVVDESAEAHPAESIRVLNYSTHTLALSLGETKGMIEPGQQQLFDYSTQEGRSRRFILAALRVEKWALVRRQLLATPPGRRVLLLVRDGRASAAYIEPDAVPDLLDLILSTDRLPAASQP